MPNNPLPLVALAGDDVVTTATIVMSNEDADFPAENAQSHNPAHLAKSTTNTTTFTITTSSVTPVAVALFQTNAESATLNGNALTMPALDSEGLRVHPWLDLTGLVAAGTSWSLVLTKATGVVWVGRISLVVALRELNVKYGWELGRLRPADIELTTRGASVINLPYGIRTKWAEGVVDLHEDESMLSSLDLSSKGKTLPMLFIPDEAVNEAWFARQVNPYTRKYPNIDVRETPLRFEELSCGPVNG